MTPRVVAALLLVTSACASQRTSDIAAATSLAPNANVLFAGGAFLQEKPSLTASEYATLTAKPARHVDICQGPRDSVDVCARIEKDCVPLALPGAWSPCYGSGALCSHVYREREMAQLYAKPPACVCSCSAEYTAAIARDEAMMRDPPP